MQSNRARFYIHPLVAGILVAALLGLGSAVGPFLRQATAASGRESKANTTGIAPRPERIVASPTTLLTASDPYSLTAALPLAELAATGTATAGGIEYTVQPGDTLAVLATRFGTTVPVLVAANHLADPATIYAGQILRIPAGNGGAPPAPTIAPAPTIVPAPAASVTPEQTTAGARILDNPNNSYPADLDPDRPYGPPVIRTDWVISKDYAAHGGHSEWGAIDFAYWYDQGAMGSEVVATHAGTVHLIPDDPIYGNWIWVVNGHYTTRYGHTRKYLVTEGQPVVRGTLLAEMGSTGHSTGPHVDYQVWQDNDNKNPMDFLK